MADLIVPDFEELRDDMLADLELGAIDSGVATPPIEVGTDWYNLAVAEASLHSITCQNMRLADADTTPLTAGDAKLDDWRESIGTTEVNPTGARGRVVVETTGTASIQANTPLSANGRRYRVTTTYINVANNDEIECEAVDTGDDTNLDPGTELQFVVAPTNVKKTAYVSKTEPLQGGLSAENDERKRGRVLNDLRTIPGAGNWGHLRKLALDASPAVQGAYIYPALGGPSSVKVVITKAFNPKIGDFTRSPSSALVEIVRQAIQVGNDETKATPDCMEVVVQGAADEALSVSLTVDIPSSVLSGGDGTGWLDPTPWPDLNGDTYVAVTSVADSRNITVGALTTTSPVAGQTHVAWWSPSDQAFVIRLVVSVSGSAGAWVLGLDQPLVSKADSAMVGGGDFVCPAATNLKKYGDTWRSVLGALGPGENTSAEARLPRARRRPFTDSQDSPALNASQTRSLQNKHKEIQDIAYSYRSATTATVPGSVATAPNVLVLDNFAIYEM
jgi:uncharacterized phage protein gp47/JayE